MNAKNIALLIVVGFAVPALAEVGDPQIRTDHPSYPGELAISTFARLFETQAESYERTTGAKVDSDEQKALASWYWRNTHYWHGEGGHRDLWGEGFNQGRDMRLREYWNGLFGYGFGLCGTTHSQWTAELEHLLGHGRGRGVGAAGHNALEVFLQGGAYGEGKWALLDHDLSTVIFNESGQRLLGLAEMQSDVDRWIDRGYKPERQRGWLVCGLHPGDGNSYRKYAVAEYLAGYAGPPPVVDLRRGERMRRYFEPGLDDGQTFVFWGRNYNTSGIPGPERSRTWVNQPENMHGSTSGTAHQNGQARFANVQYLYRPDFTTTDYREGVVDEDDDHVTFAFQTPYIIGATPPNDDAWGIYEKGCRNGLVLHGKSDCQFAISVNASRTWSAARKPEDGRLDLTDHVKGRSQYWLRCGRSAQQLRGLDLEIRTVRQANVAVLPRLKEEGTTVHFEASGKTVLSMGPELELAKTFVTRGAFGDKAVTLAATPDKPVVGLYAAAHLASGSPPNPAVRYQIEYSLDSGKRWRPLAKDWSIPRRGDEPQDFWSQSFCYGSVAVNSAPGQPIQIRFHNDGGRRNLRAEAHLILDAGQADPVKVTYDWTDASGAHRESHVFDGKGDWHVATGRRVRTRWVEFEPVP